MSEITLEQTKSALIEIIQANPTTTNPMDGLSGCRYNGARLDEDGYATTDYDGTHCIAGAVLLKLTATTVSEDNEGLPVAAAEEFSAFAAEARVFLGRAQYVADGNGSIDAHPDAYKVEFENNGKPRAWGEVGELLQLV